MPTPPAAPKMFQGSDDGPDIDRPVEAGNNTPRQIAMRTSGPLNVLNGPADQKILRNLKRSQAKQLQGSRKVSR